MNLIQMAAIEKIIAKEGGPRLHFHNITYRPGPLSIVFANTARTRLQVPYYT